MKTDRKKLLSVKEVADYLGCTDNAIRKTIKRGKIAVLRDRNGVVRITVAELDAFVSGKPATPDPV